MLAAFAAGSAEAWTFEKDITLIEPFNAGSAIDPYAQMFKQVAEKHTNVKILIEYKPGGSTNVGMNYMFSRPHDGYTVLFGAQNGEALVATEQADYDEFSYVAIANTCGEQMVLCVRADSPYHTLGDIIEYAKANPEKFNWGGASTMGFQQFFALQVMENAGVKFNYVPFENAGETCLNVLNGIVDSGTASVSKVIPYVEAGEMRIVAQGLAERDASLAARDPKLFGDIPTVYETPGQDYNKFGMLFWTTRDLICPADVPEEALVAWDNLVNAVVQDPEWIEFVKKMGALTELYMNRPDYTAYKRQATNIYRDLYKKYFAQ
jgi:tripartite-type tricarboxylate transporter receptor subunit TctC